MHAFACNRVMHQAPCTLRPPAEKIYSPVECPALINDKVHGAHSLLNGSGGVWPVAEDKVHIVELKAMQGCLLG